MTTIEFIEKNLSKAKRNLESQKKRGGVSQEEIVRLEEKVEHYEDILKEFKEAKFVRKYICEKDLVFDLLSYGKKEGFFE